MNQTTATERDVNPANQLERLAVSGKPFDRGAVVKALAALIEADLLKHRGSVKP